MESIAGTPVLFDSPTALARWINGEVTDDREDAVTQNPSEGHAGRFQRLAEEYEEARSTPGNHLRQHAPPEYRPNTMTLLDYLMRRILFTATQAICARIQRGDLEARGVLVHRDIVYPAGEISPSAITETMALGLNGELLQERVSSADEIGTRVPAWKSVTLNNSDLFDCFGAESPAIRYVKAIADRERECQEWFEGLMRQSLNERTHTNEELEKRARQRFKGLSAAGVKRAKRAAAAATGASVWSAPGRPKKSQRRKSPS